MLCAITSYFNPIGYRRRLENYRIFRERLSTPLITVELSFNDRFELEDGDATRLIRVRGGDVMFQKERLLNLGLGALPKDCKAVAWLDCDVILADRWAERAVEALRTSELVHLYEGQYDLLPDHGQRDPAECSRSFFGTSVAKKVATGRMTPADFTSDAPPVADTSWGLAWAARRELLDAHRLYDACILGSGDVAVFCAAIGGFERPKEALRMSDRRHRHYLDWARPFYQAVGGRVACVEGPILHLWHGDSGRRRYRERHQDMEVFQFDPAKDIEMTSDGCWRWSSDKPEMHAWVAGYFRSRQEDGPSC